MPPEKGAREENLFSPSVVMPSMVTLSQSVMDTALPPLLLEVMLFSITLSTQVMAKPEPPQLLTVTLRISRLLTPGLVMMPKVPAFCRFNPTIKTPDDAI